MKIINVYADNSADILEEIKSSESQKDSESKTCAIFMNYNENSALFKDLRGAGVFTTSFDGFVRKILAKTGKMLSTNVISDFVATEIISSVSNPLLKQHPSLKNLTKSSSFPRELYNLFGLFKINGITRDDLIAATSDISKDDKARFEIIIKIYEKYLETLSNNNFSDYRDIVLNCHCELKKNCFLKKSFEKNFKKIYVFGAENLSEIQLNLLKNIANDENLTLIGDENAKTRTFMGANAFPASGSTNTNPQNTIVPTNNDLFKRAIFVKNPIENKFDFKKSDSLEYRLFPDLQDEIDYISKKIIEGVKKGDKYSDYAILLRDNSLIDSITDVLKKYEIPVCGKLYCEEFEYFKLKFEQTMMMCEILQKIGAEKISALETLTPKSLVELENFASELNILTENFLSEAVENKINCEKLLSVQIRKKHRFLFTTLFFGLNMLSDNDSKSLRTELNKMQRIYYHYLNGEFVKIVSEIIEIASIKDENFHKFLAKFLTNLQELSDLKTETLQEALDFKSVLNLLQSNLSEDLETENKINLISIFKSASKTYKHVFLPALTEGYFPKKSKSAYFISDDANQKISANLKQKFPNFEKLILSNQEELKDENSLLYVALTRAEKDITISTHKFSDKKQVAPSSFFEQLVFADEQNFVSDVLKKQEGELAKEKQVENEETTAEKKPAVLAENDKIHLSASSINKFLKCPRQFFYTKLLNLKTTSSFTANYGTAVHAIFELVIKNHIENFSKETFLRLGEILFNVKNDRQALLDEGFDEVETVEELEQLSALDLEEMHTDFISAINNIEEIGYFAEKPLQGDCEKHFVFQLEEFPNVSFSGYIDAIIKYQSGWELVDYKTSADKPKLNYLFSDDGVNFITKNKFNKNRISEYDYQIPLYYFACLHSEDLENYKNNIKEVGYLYIRPKTSKKGESWKDFFPVTEIEQYKAKIVENLKTTVIDKIYEATDFEPKYDTMGCKYCDFKDYCNGEAKGDAG